MMSGFMMQQDERGHQQSLHDWWALSNQVISSLHTGSPRLRADVSQITAAENFAESVQQWASPLSSRTICQIPDQLCSSWPRTLWPAASACFPINNSQWEVDIRVQLLPWSQRCFHHHPQLTTSHTRTHARTLKPPRALRASSGAIHLHKSPYRVQLLSACSSPVFLRFNGRPDALLRPVIRHAPLLFSSTGVCVCACVCVCVCKIKK